MPNDRPSAETPVPVCCALIERDGRLLVAQRPPGKHLALQWEFPGGKVEAGEDAAQALRRELREELSCEVTHLAPLPPCLHRYDRTWIELFPFVAQLAPGSPEPFPHEHLALQWLLPDELDAIDLAPADRPVLDSYRRRAD